MAGHVQLFARTETSPIRWRLLSGNNRDLGHGVQAHPDSETCRLVVKMLQNSLDDVESRVRRNESRQLIWQLVLAGEVVATSGRAFERLPRCELAVAHFVETLRDAEIGPALLVSESRRWSPHASVAGRATPPGTGR